MSKCKKTLCLFLTAVMLLMTLSTAFCVAAEDGAAAQTSPLSVKIEMSKSSYFVTEKAKATVTVQNTGSETLTNMKVVAFSEKHLLPAGSNPSLLIPVLKAGETKPFSFEMVLNRKTAGVSFFERVLLFFTQLFRSYEPMDAIPEQDENTLITQSAAFKHGSAAATLNVVAFRVITPQVTYLDRYVRDYLKTGVYTIDMEVKGEGSTVPFTIYSDRNNLEYNTSMIALVLQNNENMAKYANLFKNIGKMRFILKDKNSSKPKAMIAVTGAYVELEDGGEIASLFNGTDSEFGEESFSLSKFLNTLYGSLQYCGATTTNGLVCETYLYDDGSDEMLYNFYFTKTNKYEGIVRWTITNLETDEISQDTNIRVYSSVTSPLAFTPVGVKLSEEQFKERFGFLQDEAE